MLSKRKFQKTQLSEDSNWDQALSTPSTPESLLTNLYCCKKKLKLETLALSPPIPPSRPTIVKITKNPFSPTPMAQNPTKSKGETNPSQFKETQIDIEKYFNSYNSDKLTLLSFKGNHFLFKVVDTMLNIPTSVYKRGQGGLAPTDDENPLSDADKKVLKKYYRSRYAFFEKFDEGIQLDTESWYSVTPEKIAEYTARKMRDFNRNPELTVVDGFSGVGGNTIQFAKHFDKVYSVEIDPAKAEMQKKNSEIYQVTPKITQLVKDFLLVSALDIPSPKSQTSIFSSPPWGGTDYSSIKFYSLFTSVTPNIVHILDQSFQLANSLVLMLPKNTLLSELITLCHRAAKKYGIPPTAIHFDHCLIGTPFPY
jgi:hypothetical protein